MNALQSFPSRLGPILTVLTTSLATPPSWADAPAAGTSAEPATRWLCWNNHDTTIRCRLAEAPAAPAAAAEDEAALASRPDLHPRRGPLPPIVAAIRERPGQLQGRTITIPMFSQPEEAAFAEALAQSVMCAGRPTCRVEFARSMAAVALLTEDDPALE